jgi:hypothetical protein
MPEPFDNPFTAELERRQQSTPAAPAGPNPFTAELDRRGLIFPTSEGLPELGSVLGTVLADTSTPNEARENLLRLRSAVNVPRSIPGKLNAIVQQMPGAQIEFAEDGTPIVDIGGDRFVINTEGFSGQDVRDVFPDIALGGPMAGGGAAGGRLLLGTAGRIGGAMLGGGASVVARDELGRALGSGEQTSPTMVALVGGLSGVGEAAAPFIAKFVGRILGNRGFVTAGGELTKKGRSALEKAGINADEITPEFLEAFRKLSQENPAAAARVAETQALGRELDTAPVPLSRGDATRDVQQQAFESAVERGARIEGVPQEAGEALRQFRQGQQGALGETAEALQARVGTETGEAFGATQAALAAEREALKASTDVAFETARGLRASLATDTVKTVGQGIGRNFRQQFNPATAPKTAAVIGQLEQFQARFPGKVTSVTVRTMENWRGQMAQLARSSDPVERAAAGQALRNYDDLVGKAVDDGLIRGDVEAVQAWATARRLRRDLFQQFEADKLVSKIVQTEDGVLKLTPTEAANVLFTADAAGGKQGAVRAIQKIGKILGKDSEAWRALKQEQLLRLFSQATKGTPLDENLGRTFSGDKFATAFEKSMRTSPELMRELFTTADLRLMAQLRRVALLATSRAPGAVNFSNTATVHSILQKMGFVGRNASDLIATALRGLSRTKTSRLVEEAINTPLVPRRLPIPAGAGGAAGGSTAPTLGEQLLNQ